MLADVLALLQDVTGHEPTMSGKGWSTCCPAHDDEHPSLSVSEGDDGRILIYCHAGCTFDAILDQIGLAPRDLFPPW